MRWTAAYWYTVPQRHLTTTRPVTCSGVAVADSVPKSWTSLSLGWFRQRGQRSLGPAPTVLARAMSKSEARSESDIPCASAHAGPRTTFHCTDNDVTTLES